MKKRYLLAVLAITAVGVAFAAHPLAARAPKHVRIRVMSVDTSRTAKFRAALVVDGAPLNTFSGETPFETVTTGPLALGVFEKVGDGANFRVWLTVEDGGPMASAPGPRAIVGHDVDSPGTAFARGY